MDAGNCNPPGGPALGACQDGNETSCTDLIDNDGDGGADCADPDDCPDQMNDTAVECNSEDTTNTCDDGFDNDGDGDIDCEDANCDGIACDDLLVGGEM